MLDVFPFFGCTWRFTASNFRCPAVRKNIAVTNNTILSTYADNLENSAVLPRYFPCPEQEDWKYVLVSTARDAWAKIQERKSGLHCACKNIAYKNMDTTTSTTKKQAKIVCFKKYGKLPADCTKEPFFFRKVLIFEGEEESAVDKSEHSVNALDQEAVNSSLYLPSDNIQTLQGPIFAMFAVLCIALIAYRARAIG